MTAPLRPARSLTAVTAIVIAALASAAAFGALGVWQVKRLGWKLDLLARVERRLAAEPAPAPDREAWSTLTPDSAEYLKVRVTGRFDHARETLVLAVTDLGRGSWVLTPLATTQGFTVLVNRGFVPPERRNPAKRAAAAIPGETTVTGLLRLTEPGGAFLRANDPVQERWFARDVAAIASARGLGDTAPYFIDADAAPNPGGWPVGGLTQVSFSNNHLVYALTWFTLALMSLAGGVYVAWDRRRRIEPVGHSGETTGA